MNNKLSANVLWDIFWKRKIHLIILTVIGFIIGIIFSGPKFITPKFKSIAIIYPSNISSYSNENESEQLMQWLKSNDVKFKVINEFNLYEHYEIEKNAPQSIYNVLKRYDGNVKIELTSSQAIRVSVLDKDPNMAYNITNSILSTGNYLIDSSHNALFKEVYDVYSKTYNECLTDIEDVSSIVSDVDVNGDMLYKILSSVGGGVKKDTLTNIYLNKVFQIKAMNEAMIKLYEGYNLAKLNVNREYNHYSIVQKPYVADKKSLPVRWVIVAFSGFALLILGYAIFVFIENVPEKSK